jgi:hypothetical protein
MHSHPLESNTCTKIFDRERREEEKERNGNLPVVVVVSARDSVR